MVPWVFQFQDGDGIVNKRVELPKGKEPAERLNLGTKGYLLTQVVLVGTQPTAVYHLIMEVV